MPGIDYAMLARRYDTVLVIGAFLWAAGCLVASKKWLKRDDWLRTLFIFGFMGLFMLASAGWMADMQMLLFPMDNAESKMRLYGPIFLFPVTMYPVFYLLGLRVTERLDARTLPFYGMVLCSKLACHFAGCCYGIPSSWGIESPYLHRTVFPVQLFEAGSIGLVIILMVLYRSSKYFKRGTLYPGTALLYAITRITWEFFRSYTAQEQKQTNLILGLNFWQIVSVIAIVLSIIWLILLPKQMRRVEAEEQRGPEISIFNWTLYRERWRLGFRNPGTAAFYTPKKKQRAKMLLKR